jgi:phosphate uptake regulator
METRKVQVTGGSTFTVSLPKEWARENDVGAGDRVEFFSGDGSLVMSPAGSEEPTRGQLDVSQYDGENLTRAVMAMYVSGFDVLELSAERITTEQRRAIRTATQNLVGLEVLEETTSSVVIRDLLDSSELSIHDAVDRMRLISRSMLEDAVTALVENDDDLATDVIRRDDEMDRLWFVVARIFRTALRSPRGAQEIGMEREACFDYHSSARQLERIADHAAKIAQTAQDLGELDEPVATSIEAIHEEAAAVVTTAMDALVAEDSQTATELANDAKASILPIDDRSRTIDDQLRELEPAEAKNLGIVVDSLSRTADYGGNIAETALQRAAPKP